LNKLIKVYKEKERPFS